MANICNYWKTAIWYTIQFLLQKSEKQLPKPYSGFSKLTLSNNLTAVSSFDEHTEWFKSIPNSKIFRCFLVFDYPLWRKTKTRKRRKSTESFLNKKKKLFNSYHYQTTAKKEQICYFKYHFCGSVVC